MTTAAAMKRVVRAARGLRVFVWVNGLDDGYYVQTTKAEALRLLQTGQFTVEHRDGDLYVNARPRA